VVRNLSYLFFLILLVALTSYSQADRFNVTGTWYYFSPEENKLMSSSEWTAYTFSDDGSVSKRTLADVDRGTYTIDVASSTMTLKFVYSQSDIRSESWRLIAAGQARIFYRTNISRNLGVEDNLLYIRQKSTGARQKSKSRQTNGELVIGGTYELSKDTPLAPELNPEDPLEAIARIQTLEAGSQVTIISKTLRDGHLWYNVSLIDASTGEVEFWWINSAALLCQNVRRIE